MLEFLETPIFTREVMDLLSDAEYAALQGALIVNPESGDLTYSKDQQDDLTAHQKRTLKRLVTEEFE